MLDLYRGSYADFTVKHFHEQLVKRHDYKLGYTVTKVHPRRAGLVWVASKRGAHRKKRPRRPMVGMMLHQDASTHAWLPGRQDDLVVTLDDATSAIYSAFLVDEEGTASSLRGLREVIGRHGLFCALCTDRGSHYFHTPEAGGKVSRTHPTQLGRALAQLGVEHIAAYSPQARGRSERAFRTLQDRLPKELALAGITTVEAANHWLAETYIAQHNAAFALEAEQQGTPSCPIVPAPGAKSSASRRTEPSATTTPSGGAASASSYRRAGSGRTSSERPCASTNTPTAPSPSSSDRTASPTTMPTAGDHHHRRASRVTRFHAGNFFSGHARRKTRTKRTELVLDRWTGRQPI